MNSPPRARVEIPNLQDSVEGIVIHADRKGIRVRLATPDLDPKDVPPGTPAIAQFSTPKGMYRAAIQIASCQQQELQLLFSGSVQRIERRHHQRYSCQMTVEFCDLETAQQQEPPWITATAIDISQGGMCLVVDRGVEVPDQIWVRSWLLGVKNPVKVGARVAHRRPSPNGKTVVSIAFEQVSRLDQTWLRQMFP